MKLIHILFFILIFATDAHAYLDPVSGSFLLNTLLTIFFLIINFFNKIFIKILGYFFIFSKRLKSNYHYVFHIETISYFYCMYEIINNINNKDILIICPPEIKKKFSKKILQSNSISIFENKNLYFQISILQAIYSDECFSSTLGLNFSYFYKSKNIKKWSYIDHSTMDIHDYPLLSLDHYDCIYLPNKKKVQNLERVFNLRGIKREIKITSLFYLKSQDRETYNLNECLLITTNWGGGSLIYHLNDLFFKIIKQIQENNKLMVILRPHPQSFISDKRKLNFTFKKFKEYKIKYSVSKDGNNKRILRSAKMLISEISGVIFDYHHYNKYPKTLIFNTRDKKKILNENLLLKNTKAFDLKIFKSKNMIYTDYGTFLKNLKKEGFSKSKINTKKLFLNIKKDKLFFKSL